MKELLTLSSAEIERCDIARMNLLCAEGLRGAENLNVETFLTRLDGIAKHVEQETRRHYYRFQNNKAEFNYSEGYFRMLLMAVTLQEDLGIHYNPERITPAGVFEPNATFFADARDVFIHGMIADDRRMGTCASMPALYVAIGRRLGYPLKLVPTQNHLFVRWEDSRERFNVDATGRGMNLHDDEHYRNWPLPISRETEQEFGYLKSMSATDELTALGRWINRDPLAEDGFETIRRPEVRLFLPQWSTPYCYEGNAPVSFIDPLGLDFDTEFSVAVAKGDVTLLEQVLEGYGGNLTAAQQAAVRQAIEKYSSTALKWISKNCKGSIAREFPSQFLYKTLEQIKTAARAGDKAAKTAWELLNDKRFQKCCE